jgi:hypothetical protein
LKYHSTVCFEFINDLFFLENTWCLRKVKTCWGVISSVIVVLIKMKYPTSHGIQQRKLFCCYIFSYMEIFKYEHLPYHRTRRKVGNALPVMGIYVGRTEVTMMMIMIKIILSVMLIFLSLWRTSEMGNMYKIVMHGPCAEKGHWQY